MGYPGVPPGMPPPGMPPFAVSARANLLSIVVANPVVCSRPIEIHP